MRPIVLAIGLCTLMSLPADAFIARNGLLVQSTGGTDFTVPYRGLSGPRDFWCAAGDYAIRVLGVPPATRIYRTSPPPRRSGQGMDFSLDARRATATGLLRISRSKGLTASFARFLCERSGRRAANDD